jgi:hypothetical protein
MSVIPVIANLLVYLANDVMNSWSVLPDCEETECFIAPMCLTRPRQNRLEGLEDGGGALVTALPYRSRKPGMNQTRPRRSRKQVGEVR